MGFYEEFIEKYDKLISWKNRYNRESKFYQKLFSENRVKTIFDCACGTGQHVIMFNKMGYSATGSDLSTAMVKKARINAKKYNTKTDFRVADFRKLSNTVDNKFDAVICVGNSLSHLSSEKDVIKALKGMRDVIRSKGVVIIQQRNYDMLVRKRQRFMPITVGKDESFFYVLDYYPNKIIFNVVNLENKTGRFNVFKSQYTPLKKGKLTKLIRKAGFRNIKFYGNYKFKKFDIRNDENLIAVCGN